MRNIYYVLAAVLATIIIALAAASFSQNALQIYTSWYMIGLWAVAASLAMFLIIKNFNRHNVFPCLLHLSLVIILVGALLTHCFGTSEDLHLRTGERSGEMTLQHFETQYYPHTKTPRNYIATITISSGAVRNANTAEAQPQTVSMNSPLKISDRRIFLSSFDTDKSGATFTITKDPYGTYTTYFGYFIFFHCIPIVLLQRFRKKKSASQSET